MTEIIPIGKFLPVDSNGYLVNTASIQNISVRWQIPIEEVAEKLKDFFGDNLACVYLRGSVPQGNAVEGVSDLDFIVIINQTPTNHKKESWRKEVKQIHTLLKRYSFIAGIELPILTASILTPADKVLLKLYGLCIYGERIADIIQPYKPDRNVVLMLGYGLELDIAGFEKRFETKDKLGREKMCTWITKRLLRSAEELVIERSNQHSRDLYMCYQVFITYYPDKKEVAYKVLDLAINPTNNLKEILPVVSSFGKWLIKECKDIYGEDFYYRES